MATDRFREIEVFVCVVGAGNFSAAARKLDCTPSAVSKLIDRLEARMGARLLQRTSRALSLTQEGIVFRQAATQVLEALREAENAVAESGAPARGTIRVHATLAFSEQQLAPDLPEFLQRHPLIRLEFYLTSDPVDLMKEAIDVSIQVGPVTHPGLVTKRIGTAQWVVCAAPAYIWRHGAPRSPDDLARHNCLNFLAQSPRSQWRMRMEGGETQPQVSGQTASNSDNFLRVLACQGLGIVRLADFHVARDIREGRLVPLLTEFRLDEPAPIFAVLPSNRHLSPRVKVFLRFLEQRLAQTSPWPRKDAPLSPIDAYPARKP